MRRRLPRHHRGRCVRRETQTAQRGLRRDLVPAAFGTTTCAVPSVHAKHRIPSTRSKHRIPSARSKHRIPKCQIQAPDPKCRIQVPDPSTGSQVPDPKENGFTTAGQGTGGREHGTEHTERMVDLLTYLLTHLLTYLLTERMVDMRGGKYVSYSRSTPHLPAHLPTHSRTHARTHARTHVTHACTHARTHARTTCPSCNCPPHVVDGIDICGLYRRRWRRRAYSDIHTYRTAHVYLEAWWRVISSTVYLRSRLFGRVFPDFT